MRSLLFLVALVTAAHAQPAPSPTPADPSAESVAPVPPADPAAPAPTPAPTPIVVAPPPSRAASRPSVMDKRWGINFSFGSQTLGIKDGQKVAFAGVDLSGRFRIKRWFEVALFLGGGGAMKGTLSTSSIFVDARFRFMAEKELNLFALVGLGAVSAAREGATDVEKAGRGAFRFGAGVEWRIARSWAAEAELRATGAGENPDVTPVSPETLNYQIARYGITGGAIMLGATFYF